jgi:hypothetical protein
MLSNPQLTKTIDIVVLRPIRFDPEEITILPGEKVTARLFKGSRRRDSVIEVDKNMPLSLTKENKDYPLVIGEDGENFRREGDTITGTSVGSSVLVVRHKHEDYGRYVRAALKINTVLPGGKNAGQQGTKFWDDYAL